MSNRRSRGGFVEGKVYVGGLPEDATSEEIDDAFHKFGRIRKIWVARRPPGFAFVEFDDHRDAEDAVRALDGTRICGVKARVELSTSSSGRGDSGRTYTSGGGGGGGGYQDRSRYRSRIDPSISTSLHVLPTNPSLPYILHPKNDKFGSTFANAG
uniref:RRM domain-containing protein n=1 Tax=Meloidogyne enterolobii TaxID=390850 RepID=A0A6V7XLI4_MELEN|nr:unnamed protein product [Meloidogyne enterolobii]